MYTSYLYRCLLPILLLAGPSSFAQSSLATDTIYRFAVAGYLSVGKVDSAIYAANQLNAQNPANQKELLLGTLYEIKNDTVSANRYYSQALANPSANPARIYHMMGMAAYRRGQTTSARDYVLRSLQYDSSQDGEYFLLGRLYTQLEDGDNAQASYLHAWRLNNHQAVYAQALFSAYQGQGKVRSSLPYLKQWASPRTASVQSRIALATQYMGLDSFAAARPLLQSLLQSAPRNDTLWYDLAVCSLELQDTAAALTALQQAIGLSAVPAHLYYDRLIAVYEAKGQQDRLLTTFRQGASKGFADYAQWLAQYDSSWMETRVILPLLPAASRAQQVQYFHELARQALARKDDIQALAWLAEYQGQRGKMTDSLWEMKAAAELNLGYAQQARQDIEEALRITPGDATGTLLLTGILYRQRDYGQLTQTLLSMNQARVVAMPPGNRNALLFKAYTQLGDETNAVRWYNGN